MSPFVKSFFVRLPDSETQILILIPHPPAQLPPIFPICPDPLLYLLHRSSWARHHTRSPISGGGRIMTLGRKTCPHSSSWIRPGWPSQEQIPNPPGPLPLSTLVQHNWYLTEVFFTFCALPTAHLTNGLESAMNLGIWSIRSTDILAFGLAVKTGPPGYAL